MHAEPARRFTIRGYEPGDEAGILELFARSFHQPRTVEHWRWKFQEDPWGREHITLAFDETGSLVGHYAGYPVPFRCYGTDLVAHQIGDTMTDPAVRHVGRGLTGILGRTATHFYETFCKGQVAFNYGFNVSNIQKFSLRFLRSDRVEPVTYRRRDLRERPLAALGRLERYARGVQLQLVRVVDRGWDELFHRVAPQYGFLVRRDAAYVEWRYLRCPGIQYIVVAIRKWGRLVGWLVFRMRGSVMTIGDLLLDADHADVLEPALRHLAHVYRAEAIEGWFPPRPRWLSDVLSELGFETLPEPQDLSVMCVPFVMADATDRMRQSLYYTMGDSDLF